MTISFKNQVAIVTGAGNGLGKSHALELARRGAKVVVNDFGGARDGTGGSSAAAQQVVTEIEQAGGEALAHGANVADMTQVQDMIHTALTKWGRVDVLINNAGILRDKSFAKMDIKDFQAVFDVHVMGTVNCTKAAWDTMQKQNYGRILMTTSSSGLYGNFGQSNYGAAKMAVIGLMNTLVLEGAKYNIRVNALAPTAGTRMTEDLLPPDIYNMLTTEAVTAGALTLCHDGAPNRTILCAGVGGYSCARTVETPGIFLAAEDQNPETVAANFSSIVDPAQQQELENGAKQGEKFLKLAMAHVKAQQ